MGILFENVALVFDEGGDDFDEVFGVAGGKEHFELGSAETTGFDVGVSFVAVGEEEGLEIWGVFEFEFDVDGLE